LMGGFVGRALALGLRAKPGVPSTNPKHKCPWREMP
jgi:hypothetical protein